jgi:hypothetical protein
MFRHLKGGTMTATDTAFGWDTSHYDAPPTSRDGLSNFLHKLTDGDHYYEDPEFKSSIEAARSFGIPSLGAYHVLHGGRSIQNQATWLLQRLDALIPWWRKHPCFNIMADAEPFNYLTTPTIAEVNGFLAAVRAAAPDAVVWEREFSYTPQWHYGQSLTGLLYRWWSSKYGSNPVGPYRSIYPGNTSARWSGPVNPFYLQYGSNATIAGQTTCDANAFRGSEEDMLRALAVKVPAPQGGVDMPTRYKFIGLKDTPSGLDGVVHITDGPWYRTRETAPVWDALEQKAGWPPIVEVRPADVANKDYQTAVTQLCGKLASSAGGGSGVSADHVHPVSISVSTSGSATGSGSGKTGSAVEPTA